MHKLYFKKITSQNNKIIVINSAVNYLHILNSLDGYVSSSLNDSLKANYLQTFDHLTDSKSLSYWKGGNFLLLTKFIISYKRLDKEIKKHNSKFAKITKNKLKHFFANIENKSLDSQQIEAIISDEDASLVIAGAGSGKTLTIIGKVKYLIEIQKIRPEQILLLSFTNKTVAELNERLATLKLDTKATTFHKLGLNILRQSQDNPVRLSDNLTLNKTIESYLEKDILENNVAIKAIIDFISSYIKPNPNIGKDSFELKTIEYASSTEKNKNINILPTNLVDLQTKNQLFLENNASNLQSIYENILKNNPHYSNDIQKLIINFITLYKENKNNNINPNSSKNGQENNIEYAKRREAIFKEFAIPAYKKYQQTLAGKSEIDFSDMINKATSIVINNKYSKKYKYIIVDEYQDISAARFELIKSLRNSSNAKIICVGDDWQSIYRFAGSDISLFNDFESYVGKAKRHLIEKTYRNSQQLVNISAKFIQKNKAQIKKRPLSNKSLNQPIKHLSYMPGAKARALTEAIKYFVNKYGQKSNILILSRHAFDIKHVINLEGSKNLFSYDESTSTLTDLTYKDVKIKYLTIHKSKGLESDNVILLNCEDSLYGFPNKVMSDPIISSQLGIPDEYPYAEERRLFYVALTRTKNEVCLLLPFSSPSIFIKEIIKKSEPINTSTFKI